MQRYFALDDKLTLNDSDYHHIKNVMRMKNGQIIEVVFDKIVYKCKVYPSDKKLEVLDTYKNDEKNVKVTLAFPLLKEQKMDYIFQKGCEVGYDSFIPFECTRTVIKFDKKVETKKKDRWNKICKEASEQCFRSDIPSINNVLKVDDLTNLNFDLKILCTLNEKSKNIKKILEKSPKYDTILIVTGPEGGFDSKEEEKLVRAGFISTTLGKNVLRAETAPIVCLSMINYEYMR